MATIFFQFRGMPSIQEVLDTLEVSIDSGLSDEEVRKRLEKYGHNELAERPGKAFGKTVEQINSFVIWLLIGAAVISAILGDWVEAGAILLIVVLNAIMGIVQESRAEASAALKRCPRLKHRLCETVTAFWFPRLTSFPGISFSSRLEISFLQTYVCLKQST